MVTNDDPIIQSLLTRIETLERKLSDLDRMEQAIQITGGGTGVTDRLALWGSASVLTSNAGLIFTGGNVVTSGSVLAQKSFRMEGEQVPAQATGEGLEFGVNAGLSAGYLQMWNRTTNAASNYSVLIKPRLIIGANSGLTGNGDLDAVGRVRGATFETSAGNKWDLRTYTAGTFAQTGYVTVIIDGVTRRLMVG